MIVGIPSYPVFIISNQTILLPGSHENLDKLAGITTNNNKNNNNNYYYYYHYYCFIRLFDS